MENFKTLSCNYSTLKFDNVVVFIHCRKMFKKNNLPCLSQQQQTWFWSTVTTLVSYTWRQNEPFSLPPFSILQSLFDSLFCPFFMTLVSLFHSPVLVSVKTFVLPSKFWLFVYFCVRAVILKCLRIVFVSDIFVLSLRVFLIFFRSLILAVLRSLFRISQPINLIFVFLSSF